MWSTILGGLTRFAGASATKYIVSGVIGLSIAVVGIKAIGHYQNLVNTKSKYDAAVLTIEELRDANQGLVDRLGEQEARHDAEVARLNADREQLDEERKAIQKRAFIEAGALKEQLRLNEDAKTWHDTAIPDAIKRLRE